jgi:hypothetical protein
VKIIFLGVFNVVRNLIIAKAPSIPSPLARLSPMACITVAATMETNINDCKNSMGVSTCLVVFSKVKAIEEDSKNESNTVKSIVIKVGFSVLPCSDK